MRNPIREYLDSRRAAQAAEELYQHLLLARQQPGFAGVDLPHDTPGGVAVLMKLLEKHPEVRVVRAAKAMTLVLDRDAQAGMSADMRTSLGLGSKTDLEVLLKKGGL